ncbi:MAG: hypothetical protein IAF58_21895 [Leptolyngbya sp.]|nr:hypothetical protein [Candidatus Melainabacteria bacterium]
MSTTMPKLFPAKSKEVGKENDTEEQEDTIEVITEKREDLLQLVHDDNKAVAELFFQFSQAEEDDEKEDFFEQIKTGLTLHAGLVEEVLYPLVGQFVEKEDKEDAEKLVFEAEAGNYISSLILDELENTEVDDDYFEAKMAILCGIVKEQVKREEKSMFDKLQMADLDFEELGKEFADRKAEMEGEAQAVKAKTTARTKTSDKTTARKAPAKKPSAKKSPAKKSTAKTASTKKATTKKSPMKTEVKATSKSSAKSTAKKKTAKKSR